MTKRGASAVVGRWPIVEIEGWETDYVGPGHIQFDREGGHIEFGAVQIGLDCWVQPDRCSLELPRPP